MAQRSGGDLVTTTLSSLILYSGISPSTSTNVEQELDYRARHTGDAKIIATLADLDFHAPADGGGMRTVDSKLAFTGIVTMNAGEWLNFTATGSMVGLGGSTDLVGVIGDYDGALVQGPMFLDHLTIQNTSAGVSAETISATSSSRNVRIEYCNLVCAIGARVGTLTNIQAACLLDTVLMIGLTGLRLQSNQQATLIKGAAFIPTPGAGAGSANFIGIDVEASATVSTILKFEGNNGLFDQATQAMISLSNAATYPTGATPSTVAGVQILACQVSGVANAILLDQSAGKLTIRDPEIVASGNVGLRNSIALGAVAFQDLSVPAVLSYADTTNFFVFPHQNVTPVALATLTENERFTLFRDGGDVNNWYIEYQGVQTSISATLIYQATLKANTGPGDGDELIIHAEIDPLGDGSWVAVDGSSIIEAQNSADFAGVVGTAPVSMSPGARFRLAARNTVATNPTALATYSLQIRA